MDHVAADVLDLFSPATRDWFAGAFAAPTAAQEGAWRAAHAGEHALVVAPTGSGKTLSAFLWALDRLSVEPPCGRSHETLPDPLRLAVEGPGGRRPAEPAGPARRDLAGDPAARAAGARHHGRHAHRRHHRGRTPLVRQDPAGRAGDHPRVAVPDPDLVGAGVPAGRRDGDRRRGARGRRMASAARTWPCRWSGWTRCWRSPRSGSACRRRSARSTR